jgi:hypothetical protein
VREAPERELATPHGILVRLCRREPPELASSELRALADAGFRSQLHELATSHRTLGLVLLALTRLPQLGELEPAARQGLLAPLPARRARAERQDHELERLLARLSAGGLEPLVLKGPALRHTIYEQSVERHFGDFDLLFEPAELERTFEIVREAGYRFPGSPERFAGYRATHFHVIFRHPDRFVAEVHWALSKPASPFRLDPEAFRRRSRRVGGSAGGTLRVPCPEHLLLHMAHENLRDSFSRLVRLVDLDRIVASTPGLDWDEIVSEARRGGLRALLGLSLDLASELLGTPVPAEVRRALRADRLGRAHVALLRPADALLHQRLGDTGPSASMVFWLAPGWRARGALLLRLARGGDYADQWIYNASTEVPPGSAARLRAGLKGVLHLAATHLQLYRRALERDPAAPAAPAGRT